MPKFTLTHEIRCNAETFWKLFFDKSFNEELYLKHLGFPAYAIVEHNETETRITHKVTGQPKMNVPAAVTKLVGPNFGYTEEGWLDKSKWVWTYKITPSSLAGKLRQEGTVRVEPIGDGKVRRVAEQLIECSVFGLGGIIESSTEKQLREGWDASAVFMNRYLEKMAAK